MRVTYWTTAPLEPSIEAISKEVFDLAEHFRGSRIVGFSRHLTIRLDFANRCYGFNSRLEPFFRGIIPLMEGSADVHHVYAEISPYMLLKTLRRKPVLLTIASEKGSLFPELLSRCGAIAVQTRGMKKRLEAAGLPQSAVRLIYPGIDLDNFQPRQRMSGNRRPSILLATFPREEHELAERGVTFLLDMAERHRGLDFHFVSRPWRAGSTALPRVKSEIARRELTNVAISEGMQGKMQDLYWQHDFTIVPFATAEGGKECPRSLTESLACGVPVLISNVAPFATYVEESQCGKSYTLDAESFASAVEAGLKDYARLSANALTCAKADFDRRQSSRTYAGLYDQLISTRRVA
jgi:glycosyltransferase involved in cell wall biosynthesis